MSLARSQQWQKLWGFQYSQIFAEEVGESIKIKRSAGPDITLLFYYYYLTSKWPFEDEMETGDYEIKKQTNRILKIQYILSSNVEMILLERH